MSSTLSIQQLEAQLVTLKSQGDWVGLASTYEALCHADVALEQRLFYAWERSELLATHLADVPQALDMLTEAALWGGPLHVIEARIEELRSLHESATLNHHTASCLERLLTQLPQLSTEDRGLLNARRQALGAPSIEDEGASFEPIEAPLESLSEGSLSGLESIDAPIGEIDLEAQDTAFREDDPIGALWSELTREDAVETNPMGFLSDLEALCELHELNAQEQARVEPLLWQAASARAQWRLWVKLYQRALYSEQALVGRDATERARRAFTLGVVLQDELNETPSAVERFQEVLELFPNHQEVFERARVLLQQQRRWGELTELIKRFVPHATSAELRFELNLALGDVYREQIKSIPKAVAAWFEALEAIPESRQVFVRLLEVYQETEKWGAAVKVLKQLSRLDPEPEKRAFYTYTMGLIQRDRLGDSYLAVRRFDEALDVHPPFLKAFQAIEDTLSGSDDHARRDRYYRKMLVRAVEHQLDASLIAELGRQLGKMNLYELGLKAEATRAYEVVLSYEPADDEAHRGLIAVKLQEGAPLEATKIAFQWVRRAPTHVDAYKALYDCAYQAGRLDWAWCVANVLRSLGDDHPERAEFIEQARAQIGSRLTRPLSEQEWRLLAWTGLDETWGVVIGASAQVLAGPLQIKPKLYQSHVKRGLVDCGEASTFGRIAQYLSTSLGLALPKIWSGGLKSPGSIGVVSFGELGMYLSDELLATQSLEVAVARLSYGLYLAQAERWMAGYGLCHEPLEERLGRLRSLGEAHLALLGREGVSPEAQKMLGALKGLSPELLTALKQTSPVGDLDRWLRGVEQSAYRVALLMSCDLKSVIELMRAEPSISGDSFEARLYKLLLFAVSPPYIELRSNLGLSYQAQLY